MACKVFDNLWHKSKINNAKKLKVAAFMTEFGDGGGSKKSVDEIYYVSQYAEGYLHSWTYWQFKYY